MSALAHLTIINKGLMKQTTTYPKVQANKCSQTKTFLLKIHQIAHIYKALADEGDDVKHGPAGGEAGHDEDGQREGLCLTESGTESTAQRL